MHFFAAVIVPPGTTRATAEDPVRPILEPYDENLEDPARTEERTEDGHTWRENPQGKWDWWVIGGRWTAVWDDTYNPTEDPANHEPCFLCEGTGMQNDKLAREIRLKNPDYTCNGCSNSKWPGWGLKHPPKFTPRERDVIDVDEFLRTPGLRRPYTLVTPEGWVERGKSREFASEAENAAWDEEIGKALGSYSGHRLAVVDYHC